MRAACSASSSASELEPFVSGSQSGTTASSSDDPLTSCDIGIELAATGSSGSADQLLSFGRAISSVVLQKLLELPRKCVCGHRLVVVVKACVEEVKVVGVQVLAWEVEVKEVKVKEVEVKEVVSGAIIVMFKAKTLYPVLNCSFKSLQVSRSLCMCHHGERNFYAISSPSNRTKTIIVMLSVFGQHFSKSKRSQTRKHYNRNAFS